MKVLGVPTISVISVFFKVYGWLNSLISFILYLTRLKINETGCYGVRTLGRKTLGRKTLGS